MNDLKIKAWINWLIKLQQPKIWNYDYVAGLKFDISKLSGHWMKNRPWHLKDKFFSYGLGLFQPLPNHTCLKKPFSICSAIFMTAINKLLPESTCTHGQWVHSRQSNFDLSRLSWSKQPLIPEEQIGNRTK